MLKRFFIIGWLFLGAIFVLQAKHESDDGVAKDLLKAEISGRSNRHCNFKTKRCFHTITLGLEDATFTPLPSPTFDVMLEIIVAGPLVTVTIPSINFILPVSGYVYTAALNLPKNLWPVTPVPPASFLGNDGAAVALLAYIYADGTLRIKGLGGDAIPAGTYSTNALTFSYSIPCPEFRAPENFKISTKSSNIIGTAADNLIPPQDYANRVSGDIRGDRVAFCWIQTQSGVPQDQKRTQLMVATGTVDHNENVKLNKPVLVYLPPANDFTFDAIVLIDPSNPDHLVASNSTVISVNGILSQVIINIFHSHDFGKTWTGPQLGPIVGPAPRPMLVREEQNMLFDNFGNLYLSFFIFSFTFPALNVSDGQWQLFNSTNGGIDWTNIFVIKAPAKTIADFQGLAFGPDGKGGHALWYGWTNIFEPFVGPQTTTLWAGYLPVLGKGHFGKHVEFALSNVPVNTASNVQIAVGNKGQVYLSGQQYNPLDFSSPGFESRLFLYLNPTGTVNFNADSFQKQRDIFVTNLGQDAATDPTPVSWQPGRGFWPFGINFFAYDNKKGRLYAVGVDRRPNFNIADYVSIFYIYTDNDGATWSDMYPVNNVTFGSRGLPSVAFEPSKGLLSIGFYDTRDHGPANTTVDFWGTIFNPLKFIRQ